MVGAHFHCRTFLLTTFLYFCLLRHSYELVLTRSADDSGFEGFEISCDENESLSSTGPVRYYIKKDFAVSRNEFYDELGNTPTGIEFNNCRPPNKPYLEILKDNNINASRVSTIYFHEMPDADLLNESLFEGLQLDIMLIYDDDVRIEYHGKQNLTNVSEYSILNVSDHIGRIEKNPFFSNRLLNVTHVKVTDWLNVSTYYEILRKQNIRPSSVQELSVYVQWGVAPNLKAGNFKGLSLPKLNVMCYFMYFNFNETSCKLDASIFEELEANELYMHGTEPTLNKFTAEKVKMEYGEISGEWSNCSTLTSLELYRVTVTTAGWLRHCGNLTDLTLRSLSYEEVERTLTGASALITLSVSGEYYDKGFKGPFAMDAVNLRRLKFKGYLNNNFNVDAFSAMKQLEELDISENELRPVDFFHAIAPLQNLRMLSADQNRLQTFCDDYHNFERDNFNGDLYPIRTVESVSLQNCGLTELCFNKWKNLRYLDLRHNHIISLQLKELPAPQNHALTVDLRGNPLGIPTENIHYEDTVEQFKRSNDIIILLDLTVECNCKHMSFVKALRNLPQISLENATCTSGERLVDFTGETFGCHIYSCHNCTCRTDENGTTTAYCDSKNLDSFVAYWNRSKEIVVKKIVVLENDKEKYSISLIKETDLGNNTTAQHNNTAVAADAVGRSTGGGAGADNTSPAPVTLQQIAQLLDAKLASLARELKQEIHDQFKQTKADINERIDFLAEQLSKVKKDMTNFESRLAKLED